MASLTCGLHPSSSRHFLKSPDLFFIAPSTPIEPSVHVGRDDVNWKEVASTGSSRMLLAGDEIGIELMYSFDQNS